MTVTESQRPHFDFGRVVSRTSGLIGRNFVPFAVLSFIFAGIPSVVVMLIQPSLMASASEPTLLLIVVYAAAIVSYLAGLVLTAALTRASVDDLSGKPVAIGNALSTSLPLILPMLGLGVLMILGIIAGLFLLIVPGIYLMLRWAVSAPVLVVERPGVFKSMARSASLTENHRWAILGLFVLFFVAVLVVQMIVVLMLPGGMAVAGYSTGMPSLLVIVVMTIVQIVTSMVATVGLAAIYFELRQIKDGVDVTELANVFS